jgi:hypothetical protein
MIRSLLVVDDHGARSSYHSHTSKRYHTNQSREGYVDSLRAFDLLFVELDIGASTAGEDDSKKSLSSLQQKNDTKDVTV